MIFGFSDCNSVGGYRLLEALVLIAGLCVMLLFAKLGLHGPNVKR